MKERFLALFHHQKKFTYFPLTLICVFVGSLLVIWALLARSYGVERFKQEFEKTVAGLNDIGYDVAYDDISFSAISPFKIATIKNFKLYKKDSDNFWAWNVEELGVNASILNYGTLIFYFSDKQSVQFGNETFPAHAHSNGVGRGKDGQDRRSSGPVLLLFRKPGRALAHHAHGFHSADHSHHHRRERRPSVLRRLHAAAASHEHAVIPVRRRTRRGTIRSSLGRKAA